MYLWKKMDKTTKTLSLLGCFNMPEKRLIHFKCLLVQTWAACEAQDHKPICGGWGEWELVFLKIYNLS